MSKLNLLKFYHSKSRTTSHTTMPLWEESIPNPRNNYSWICCSQCNLCWYSSCVQILPKDLVKYSKYHIHYSCLFFVVKEVSSNEKINPKLNNIPTSNINNNKAADTEQVTNKAASYQVSKFTNVTLSRTAASKK